jgi:hypothetical protein
MSEQIYRARVAEDGKACIEVKFINPPDGVWRAALRDYFNKGWHMFRMLAEQDAERINRGLNENSP